MIKRNNILFVIGIDTYDSAVWPNLNNATLDASEVAKILTTRYGFELFQDPLYNSLATKQKIIDGLNSLREYVLKEDNVMIYFAGHGQMHPVSGRGYWVPYGATLGTDTMIENSVIKDFMEDVTARHTLLISDSCFSGTFLSRTRGAGQKISYFELDSKKSRWMFASGREERVSDGNPGMHSPFAGHLISYLNGNDNYYTSVKEIVRYVSALTMKSSQQTPYGAPFDNIGDEGGEMILVLQEPFFKQQITYTIGTTNTLKLRSEQLLCTDRSEVFAAGKEVLLGISFMDGNNFMIIENFRFDEDGNKKLSFHGDEVLFNDDFKMKLVQRFATNSGLMRYLEQYKDKFKDKEIVFIKASEEIDLVETSPYAIAHSEYIQDLLSFNKDHMTCLHCGDKINDSQCYTIEIDEHLMEDAVGMVHFSCVAPTNRILGLAGYREPFPVEKLDFDAPHWLLLLERGQGQLAGYKKSFRTSLTTLAWNSSNHVNDGPYCIRVNYDDGYTTFVTKGKDIHRFKESEIEIQLERFNKSLRAPKLHDDIPARITERNIFGYSHFLSIILREGETISKVASYDKARYSKMVDINSSKFDNDYTPLGILLDYESGQEISILGLLPLISDPLKFDELYSNWEISGHLINKCKLKIIKSDLELEVYLKLFEQQNLMVVIDPFFDKETQQLASGFIVRDMTQDLINIESKKWKEGQLAILIFGENSGNYPKGILLTDEFIAEDGELSVIWRPVENDKELQLQYIIPVKFLREAED